MEVINYVQGFLKLDLKKFRSKFLFNKARMLNVMECLLNVLDIHCLLIVIKFYLFFYAHVEKFKEPAASTIPRTESLRLSESVLRLWKKLYFSLATRSLCRRYEKTNFFSSSIYCFIQRCCLYWT